MPDFGSEKKNKSKSKRSIQGSEGSSRNVSSYTSSVDEIISSSSSSTAAVSPPQTIRGSATLPHNSSLSRSYSIPCQSSFDSPRFGRSRLSFFGRKNSDLMSSSASSFDQATSSNSTKTPSPLRLNLMYHAVRKGVREHISVNTAELNVLQVRHSEMQSSNVAQNYEVDKYIKHLERVISKLQYQQSQLDELHETYTLQQRYREGAYKLKSALNSSRVSRRTSMLGIKSDLSRCTETLCQIEQQLVTFLGRFHVEMKGLLGFARLRTGDHYEVIIRYGTQKWKMKGSVKSSFDQTWGNTTKTLQPLLNDLIHIRVNEVKILGKHSTVGNVTCETKDLFKVEPQDLLVDLNDMATLKLNLKISWSPYDGYESPANASVESPTHSLFSTTSRIRSKSVVERSNDTFAMPRSRLSSAFSRPLSVIYSSSAARMNYNGNNNNHENSELQNHTRKHCLNEEDAFMAALTSQSVSKPEETQVQKHDEIVEQTDNIATEVFQESCDVDIKEKPTEMITSTDQHVGYDLVFWCNKVNSHLNDYRGRYKELKTLETILTNLQHQLKATGDRINEVILKNTPVIDVENTKGKWSTSGTLICDEAIIVHLKLVHSLLNSVGVFGPLKVNEILALDQLQDQANNIGRLCKLAPSKNDVNYKDMEEFKGRPVLLKLWERATDDKLSFCISGCLLRLELTSMFGASVRSRHPDVGDQAFSELVKRILSHDHCDDIEIAVVTMFQVTTFVSASTEEQSDDLDKLVEKLALEMFITSTLSSGVRDLVLVAIKRLSSLLALKLSNLRALSHLLLDQDSAVRTAAAAHIKHISTEELLREKAITFYARLLESTSKKDRQCACISLGFLSAQQCIPQLAYLFHSDTESTVREAASNVLLSLGEEGAIALEHASSTLLAQTMTQQVSLKCSARMGTAM